jgi:predicted lipoprotein with Yx(FWY)xxD motif
MHAYQWGYSMRRLSPVLLFVVALAATSLPALSSAGSAGAVTRTPRTAAHTVVIETTALGKVLANGKGHTLYISIDDKTPGKSNCAGACAVAWPPLHVSGKPTFGPGVKASMFKVITRADHTKQLAVNGKPLYTWFQDTKPREATGEAINGFYAVHPNGTRY